MAAKPHLFGIARGAADPPPTRFVSREIFVVAAVPAASSVPATRRPLQKNRQSLKIRMLFRSVRLFRSSRALAKNLRTSRRDVPTYGVPVGEVAGAGVPKLKFTAGALSAPGCAAKNGRGAKPNIPAIKFVGKLRTAVL